MLRTAALLAATLLLAGCVPTEPSITPAPEPVGTPIFASDEEALAAATEAYAKYLEAFDDALTTYDVEDLNVRAEGHALDTALSKAEEYEQTGKHQVGKIAIASSNPTDLQSVLQANADMASIQIYGCIDLTDVVVLNRDGESLVSADRPDRVLVLVTLVWHTDLGTFKVSETELWRNDC